MLKKLIYTLITDFLPIIFFILVYDRKGFVAGTITLIIATLVSVIFSYWKDKRLPLLPIFIALVTSVFGLLTLDTMDPKYIQMRDSFYDGTFAFILLVTLLRGKLILKDMFGHVFVNLERHDWITLSWNWIIHFTVLAISNEIVRRYYEHFWLDYKSLVIFLTIFHGALLIYFFRKKL